jgi:hypothetical protein
MFLISLLRHVLFILNSFGLSNSVSLLFFFALHPSLSFSCFVSAVEQTDAIVWVVDSADKRRLEVCRDELHQLLDQEKLAGKKALFSS